MKSLERQILALARRARSVRLFRRPFAQHAQPASCAAPDGPRLTSSFAVTVHRGTLIINFAGHYSPSFLAAKSDPVIAIYRRLAAIRALKDPFRENSDTAVDNQFPSVIDLDGTGQHYDDFGLGYFNVGPISETELYVRGAEPIVVQLARLLAISRDFAISHGPEPLSQHALAIAHLTDLVEKELVATADPSPPLPSQHFSSYARTIATHLITLVTDNRDSSVVSVEREVVYRVRHQRHQDR